MGAFDSGPSIEGDVYVQRLATYIRSNEEALANGLLCFSKVRSPGNVKPLRPSFTTHHLYYVSERIANLSLDVDVGSLNVKLDSPNHEPTFISFMANHVRSQRNFESDARSISSINSMKSIVSSASVYWMLLSFSKDPRAIQKDVKYLYLSFTKIPCLILSPRTKTNSVVGYEEYPCDTSVPLQMFKNLQVLELVEYEPNEVYGWHALSEKLRILIVRNTKLADLAEVLYMLVNDDEHGRASFNVRRPNKKPIGAAPAHDPHEFTANSAFVGLHRHRSMMATSAVAPPIHKEPPFTENGYDKTPLNSLSDTEDPPPLPGNKWVHMKQLTVTESSITRIPGYVFRPLSNLVKLNLSNNLLENFPEGLEHLPHLKYLNLADNYITTLKSIPHTLCQLVTVNLNNNKITDLSGIEGLRALEKVDLRRNQLQNLQLLVPLVKQVSMPDSRLCNVFVSNNNLQHTYRTDLFNLFNSAKPKNVIKIDDSRPGYFERAMLLDPDSARRFYYKVMEANVPAPKRKPFLPKPDVADTSPKTLLRKNLLNLQLPPATPEKQKNGHKHSESTGDVLETFALLHIQDLENTLEYTFAPRKHASVMTTASSTMTSTASSMTQTGFSIESTPTSPSIRSFPKGLKPLLPSASLCNLAHNGSSSTIKSSGTMARLDLDSAALTNLALSVITPVQVQVEGFH